MDDLVGDAPSACWTPPGSERAARDRRLDGAAWSRSTWPSAHRERVRLAGARLHDARAAAVERPPLAAAGQRGAAARCLGPGAHLPADRAGRCSRQRTISDQPERVREDLRRPASRTSTPPVTGVGADGGDPRGHDTRRHGSPSSRGSRRWSLHGDQDTLVPAAARSASSPGASPGARLVIIETMRSRDDNRRRGTRWASAIREHLERCAQPSSQGGPERVDRATPRRLNVLNPRMPRTMLAASAARWGALLAAAPAASAQIIEIGQTSDRPATSVPLRIRVRAVTAHHGVPDHDAGSGRKTGIMGRTRAERQGRRVSRSASGTSLAGRRSTSSTRNFRRRLGRRS